MLEADEAYFKEHGAPMFSSTCWMIYSVKRGFPKLDDFRFPPLKRPEMGETRRHVQSKIITTCAGHADNCASMAPGHLILCICAALRLSHWLKRCDTKALCLIFGNCFAQSGKNILTG